MRVLDTQKQTSEIQLMHEVAQDQEGQELPGMCLNWRPDYVLLCCGTVLRHCTSWVAHTQALSSDTDRCATFARR